MRCGRDGTGEIEWSIRTPSRQADLEVVEQTGDSPTVLPAASPFANLKEARRFAGPLPYTFTWEPETHSIISVLGMRQQWDPEPAAVEVCRNTFLDQEPYRFATPILASAFRVREIPYRWLRGTLNPVEAQ